MKILIINTHLQDGVGGSEVQCDIIAKYLSFFGNEAVYGAVKPKKENYETENYKVLPLKGGLSFYSCLKTEKPDVVYWRYNKKKLLPGVLISKFFRVKFVFAVSHIKDTNIWSWKKPKNLSGFIKQIKNSLKSGINHLGFLMVDGVAVNNRGHLDKLFPKKQIVIHNSVEENKNIEVFNWSMPFILWVSNIKARKQPIKFLELAQSLKNQEIDFLMVGKIQDKKFNYLKGKKHLPPNFHYLGGKTNQEINSMLKSSLFLVHTCLPEGFPNIFIQAWSQKKPVVSLAFDPESLLEQQNLGFYSKNFEQFKKDTEKLLGSPKLISKIGQKAYHYAKEEFNPENNVKKLESFLNNI